MRRTLDSFWIPCRQPHMATSGEMAMQGLIYLDYTHDNIHKVQTSFSILFSVIHVLDLYCTIILSPRWNLSLCLLNTIEWRLARDSLFSHNPSGSHLLFETRQYWCFAALSIRVLLPSVFVLCCPQDSCFAALRIRALLPSGFVLKGTLWLVIRF